MATLGSPSPPSSPRRRRGGLARRIERCCCTVATFFPLAFVYGVTTWAVWVEVHLGLTPSKLWTGKWSSLLGFVLYVMLNWSYTVAVFTDPGSPLGPRNGYSQLPTQENRPYTSFTVKSTGDIRYCKKCRTKKPDRAHHCSTCRRCVLKMDHHCPWLATCVGLRNYKPFLLFLIYLTFFCFTCFAVSATWVWRNVLDDAVQEGASLMPVNYILLAVLSGIIGIVIAGFTSWHIYLAGTNTTTIEKLEKTRYLSPLRKSMQHHLSQRNPVDPSLGDQLREIHANVLPGITRREEGVDSRSPTPQPQPHHHMQHHADPATGTSPAQNALRRTYYSDLESQRARDRYADYLDETDSAALPHAFDLGWRRNLRHVFGPVAWLWAVPVCNTVGDGWQWPASEKWVRERERLRGEREVQQRAQRERERAAGWGVESPVQSPRVGTRPAWAVEEAESDGDEDGEEGGRGDGNDAFLTTSNGVARIPGEGRRSPGKANQILGRWGDGDAPHVQTFDRRRHDAAARANAHLRPWNERGEGTQMQDLDFGRPEAAQVPNDDDEDDSSDDGRAERRSFLKMQSQGARPHSTQRQAPAENWNDVPDDMLARTKKGKGGAADKKARDEQEWEAWSPR